MKKLLISLMAMIMMSSTAVFAASETPVSDWLNKQTAKVTNREKDAATKSAEAKKKHQEKVQKEREKAAKAKQKRQEKIQKEKEKAAKQQAQHKAKQAETNSKIQTKKQQLKEFFTFD